MTHSIGVSQLLSSATPPPSLHDGHKNRVSDHGDRNNMSPTEMSELINKDGETTVTDECETFQKQRPKQAFSMAQFLEATRSQLGYTGSLLS